MSSNPEALYETVGRHIAESRKQKGLSQASLASRLTGKRTQAWISTVESGRRNVNAADLFEIATVLDTTIGELFGSLSRQPSSTPMSLSDHLSELDSLLPIEMPVYLQRDLGDSDPIPVDYQYASSGPGKSIFNDYHPLAQKGSLRVMVVERYYNSPRLDPTDLVTFTPNLIPSADPDVRRADRVIVKLKEPYDGLTVHSSLFLLSGDVEITLTRKKRIVFSKDTFEILGVHVLRRTLYRSSVIRAWIQRQFGITKDERMVE